MVLQHFYDETGAQRTMSSQVDILMQLIDSSSAAVWKYRHNMWCWPLTCVCVCECGNKLKNSNNRVGTKVERVCIRFFFLFLSYNPWRVAECSVLSEHISQFIVYSGGYIRWDYSFCCRLLTWPTYNKIYAWQSKEQNEVGACGEGDWQGPHYAAAAVKTA